MSSFAFDFRAAFLGALGGRTIPALVDFNAILALHQSTVEVLRGMELAFWDMATQEAGRASPQGRCG